MADSRWSPQTQSQSKLSRDCKYLPQFGEGLDNEEGNVDDVDEQEDEEEDLESFEVGSVELVAVCWIADLIRLLINIIIIII